MRPPERTCIACGRAFVSLDEALCWRCQEAGIVAVHRPRAAEEDEPGPAAERVTGPRGAYGVDEVVLPEGE